MNSPVQALEHLAVAAAAATPVAVDRTLDLITRLEDVPTGALLTQEDGELELNELRRLDVVVIGVSQGFSIGLFSEDVFGQALMYDVIAQAKANEIAVQPRIATKEVIRLVYEGSEKASTLAPSDSTSIELLIRSLIDDASNRKASDIHIETRDNRADVLFRIHGERIKISSWPYDTAKAMGQVLYGVHADVQSKKVGWDIYEVSEGSIDWVTGRNERLQLRFSSSPIFPTGNFHIVIRLMSTRAQPRSLGALGYADSQLKPLNTFTNGSGGMVLMVGPTNSGKSTTMQSMIENLYQVRGRETKVITVEDPVELVIPGACQISVGRQRVQQGEGDESAFTSFLRGTLRQDPDVVLVGEIRDPDSASIACNLALAGRKVFATLHTNSALWAFSRLREMGVRQELLTMPGFIAGICYQKLVPVLCQHCAVSDAPIKGQDQLQDFLLQHIGPKTHVKRRGAGCEHCGNLGITGRTLVAEIVTPNRNLLSAFADGDSAKAESLWRSGQGNPSVSEGMVTSHDHLVSKILAGLVSIADAKNYIGVADEYHYTRGA
ncbi:GspE/PulE family protein [Paucibacter soli]|uniref:GspE/PulE family protein n=1 Tax=Paucibacter soli TaxID=3133433 RepID=UPI00309CA020